MDEYLSERQQIDQMRGWVKDNAPWAIAGILIGLGALLGWQQWQNWQQRQSVTASDKYTATLEALSKSDVAGAMRTIKELRADYARTPYADLASLALARYEVEAGKLGDAQRDLGEVAQATRDPELKNIVLLRLARVQLADGKPDLALATLASAAPGPGAAPFADVRGDALLAKGDKPGALAAWREALASKVPGLVNAELIELKVAALGAPATAPAAPAPAPVAAGVKP